MTNLFFEIVRNTRDIKMFYFLIQTFPDLIRFGLFRFLSCLLPIPVVGQDVCFILSNLVAEGQRLIDVCLFVF